MTVAQEHLECLRLRLPADSWAPIDFEADMLWQLIWYDDCLELWNRWFMAERKKYFAVSSLSEASRRDAAHLPTSDGSMPISF